MGATVETRINRAGFYPIGGGEIEVKIKPSKISGNENWQSDNKARAVITLGNLDESIAIREKKIFLQNGIEEIYMKNYKTLSPGNAVLVWKDFVGAYVLGEKGKRAEIVAQEAIDEFKRESAAEVDRHLADQLLLYAAIAEGRTRYKTSEITEHLKTNAEVIRLFIEKNNIENNNIVKNNIEIKEKEIVCE